MNILALSAITASLFYACGSQKNTGTECGSFLTTYHTNVKPIIDNNCANSCHSAASHAAGIDLSTYSSLKAVASQPKFIGSVRHLAGFSAMPKKAPKMADSTVQVLSCWVKNGMPE